MTGDGIDILHSALNGAGGWVLTALRIALIVILAWVVAGLLQGLIRRFRERIAQRMEDTEAVKRAETLGRVFSCLVAVMLEVAKALREVAAWCERILDGFELAGVERWDDSAVVLRPRFRVAPLAQWAVRREYLRRPKAA